MKACVLHGIGELRCEETATPIPKRDEVLLRVSACGVCGSDVPRVFSKGAYRFPIIPGHEIAGEVVETGEAVEPNLEGRRMTVFPLIPCRRCMLCEAGEYALCEDYDYLGSRRDGGFAEYVCAPAWNLVPVPDELCIEYAALAEPAAVAVHAIRRGSLEAGDTVLILGAGAVGLLAAMWSRIQGARDTLLADIDDRRLAYANALGFPDTCHAGQCDVSAWTRDRTACGADVVIEASGSSTALEQGLLAARPLGRVVLLGNPSGPMTLSQGAYWAILRKELTLHGVWNSMYRDVPRNEWRLALDFMASGWLDLGPLITHRVGLAELPDALVMIRDRTEFSCKVMCMPVAG